MARRHVKEKYPRNLTGLKFGKLTVIRRRMCYPFSAWIV